MKLFALLSLFILSVACNEDVPGNLNDKEREYLNEIANKQCLSDHESSYNYFKQRSFEYVMSNDAFKRANGFTHKYTSDGYTRTVDIKVWKRDPNTNSIYFIVEDKLGSTTRFFLRLTKVQNDEMIDQLLKDHCGKFYTSTANSNGPVTVVYEFDHPASQNRDYYKDTYVLNFNHPAYFGRFQKTRSITEKNSNGDQVKLTEFKTATFEAKAYSFDDGNSNTNDEDPTSIQYAQNFCEIIEVGNEYRFTNTTDDTYQTQSWPISCSTTLPVGWDLTSPL